MLPVFNFAVKKFMNQRMDTIHAFMENPIEVQEVLFKQLLKDASKTAWGEKYDYKNILSSNQFSKDVPVSTYETFYPWIERCLKGEQQILWHSTIDWFSKSSGTTNAKSKFIPVSAESLKECHYKGGKDLLTMYFDNVPTSKLFEGKSLAVGGSCSPNPFRNDSQIGDISAVIMANLPTWAQYARTPSIQTALMNEWEEKIDKLATETAVENVSNLSGVPTWAVLLLEYILDKNGKKNMLEIWPNFECFFHGAVSFHPYRCVFKKFFPSDQVHYMETYNASEGFFGVQDDLSRDDLLLLLDHGIYYEFIPIDEIDAEFPKAIPLSEVQLNESYALVISTNSGLWRYNVGDVVRITSVVPYRIKITGRTKHYINVFGEELVVENAEMAIAKACEQTGAVLANFTAAPIFFNKQNKGGHEWIIEFISEPNDRSQFTILLDRFLQELNSDYEAKRYKDMALLLPTVHYVKEGTFYTWLKLKGKLGGQHKVPRLSNTREYVEEILEKCL
jgi:hypothetical protein